MYKRILVPIDGSETAERGLAEAIVLARELKATIRLLNLTSDFVVMVEMSTAIDYEKFREGLNQFGQRLLDEASEKARAQASPPRRRCTTSAAGASPTRSSRKPARAAAT